MNADTRVPGSFRDPSGFMFLQDNVLYRQINKTYRDNYEQLINSGLYEKLVSENLLVSHEEVKLNHADNEVFKVIKPEIIDFISYPYEWCFSQLKNAALLTLNIQKTALSYGMSLKDCSAYNVQFNNRPIFIDTLSFEKYQEGKPWVAYKQFCEHFLAPLALASYRNYRLSRLFCSFLDGIPLDMASSLLPSKTYINHHLLIHIHLHSKAQKKYSSHIVDKKHSIVSRMALLGLIDSLETAIKKINYLPLGSVWSNYYDDTNYSIESFDFKKQIVSDYLEIANPSDVWDLGANDGLISRVAGRMGASTISFDFDHDAVENNYRSCLKENDSKILPLIVDLTNPSPKIGWQNEERLSLFERGPADAALALALVHHLAITNNLKFEQLADFFNKIGNWLIIEFIPKSDSQVQRLLSSREDVFENYTQREFEEKFSELFVIKNSIKFNDSDRILYLMVKR